MPNRDPRTKLEIAHMVLYRLAHNGGGVDEFSMQNALKEIDDFIEFFIRHDDNPVAFKIIDLLKPGRRIIEIYANGDSSLKELVEGALADFNNAVNIIGDMMDKDWDKLKLLYENDGF